MRLSISEHGYVELVRAYGEDLFVANVARTSYVGESKGEEKDRALVEYLMENHHNGPFEFVGVVLKIKCPKFVYDHVIRHRTFSFNAQSARYVKLPDEFWEPDGFRGNVVKNKQSSGQSEMIDQEEMQRIFQESIAYSHEAYQKLLNGGVCREQSRAVLPTAIYTTFMVFMDLRNALHFLDLRDDPHAQLETQEYARAVSDILRNIFPVSWNKWNEGRKGKIKLYQFDDGQYFIQFFAKNAKEAEEIYKRECNFKAVVAFSEFEEIPLASGLYREMWQNDADSCED